MYKPIIIFTHYGSSPYLKYTLSCAKENNLSARCIILGDETNREIAIACGWEHYNAASFEGTHHKKFKQVFRHIQGSKHNHIHNGKDWLKYVFERWLFIEGFVSEFDIKRFWHFDSDTMILKSLNDYEWLFGKFDFSVQCNGTCLNGLVKSEVVTEFCEHICHLFEDERYMEQQREEFETLHPEWAFTEMRAFNDYKKYTSRPWVHLLTFSDVMSFDDCLCQEHGFEMTTLPSGEVVKRLDVRNGKFYGIRDNTEIEFITLNLSWLPVYVFEWISNGVRNATRKSLSSHCPQWLKFKRYIKGLICARL